MFRVTLLLFPSLSARSAAIFTILNVPRNISLMRHRLAGDYLNLSSCLARKIFKGCFADIPCWCPLLREREWREGTDGRIGDRRISPLKRIRVVKIHEEYSQTVHVPPVVAPPSLVFPLKIQGGHGQLVLDYEVNLVCIVRLPLEF